jgi:hypothetical protein
MISFNLKTFWRLCQIMASPQTWMHIRGYFDKDEPFLVQAQSKIGDPDDEHTNNMSGDLNSSALFQEATGNAGSNEQPSTGNAGSNEQPSLEEIHLTYPKSYAQWPALENLIDTA